MDRYSLIVVTDETKPIRRLDLHKRTLKRAGIGAGVAACIALGLFVDYVRVRIDHSELGRLREVAREQQERIAGFESAVGDLDRKLAMVAEFERKVRVIANLPGSVAAGGAEVTEEGPAEVGAELGTGDALPPDGQGGDDELGAPPFESRRAAPAGAARGKAAAPHGDRVGLLRREAERLGLVADARALSLAELVDQLEDKHQRLASSPAIWPARGWLTSRFGPRISPFTGERQFHAGLDISGAEGTEIVAPADGRVAFVGAKGPLGNTLMLDHGFGIRTQYGHTQRVLVKQGETVHRGQVIARVGNTGRSTGPHLHYVVEVGGKAVNPIDYIFD
jgi:murein DD-endopeptidase MepM/ murein hydrolase activator NlpD